jgi:hypothetical protein
MGSESQALEQVEKLIEKGKKALATHRPNPPNVIGFPTLDSGAYAEWDAQSLSFLTGLLGPDHVYVENFKSKGEPEYISSVETGIGVLKAVREDLAQGNLGKPKAIHSTSLIEQICTRFHLVARQLRSRHQNRETLSVQDEYDVQDLLHALLWLHFEDVRAEEYTPSYAGKSSRMDFLLKRERIVVEVKKTRPALDAQELSTQLIEDIERYKSHPDCGALICFVYDPEGFIPNPRGIENDLNRDDEPFPVRVLIRPA